MVTSESQPRRKEMQDTSAFCTGCGEMFLEGEEKKQVRYSRRGWPDVWIHVNAMCFSDWFGE